MEISWEIVVFLVVGFFAIAGFSRGWWKEGLTTIFLMILFIFLQMPNWAQAFIDLINWIINTIWGLIPDGWLNFGPDSVITTASGTAPIQADAGSPETWVVILILFIGVSVLWGRRWLGNVPTLLGSLLGLLIGGLNGFLTLNLVREYLDGRGLPGGESVSATASKIVLAGNSAFSPPASSVTIQAADLPDFTILDSNIPWFILGGGLLLTFVVLKTRFGILSNAKGMRKLSFKELPPLHTTPKKPKPKVEDCLKVLADAQRTN